MKRIYTAVFRNWYPSYAWFGRDSGLVTEGLRSIGVESKLVILDTPGMPADERFRPASREQFCDPAFWNSLEVDAVVLQGGGEAATQPVADAIKASTAKLVYRMDSDGIVDPSVNLPLFFYAKWWTMGNPVRLRYIWWEEMAWRREKRLGLTESAPPASLNSTLLREFLVFGRRWLARPFAAPLVCMLKLLFPRKFGAHAFALRLAKADAVLVESPLATARLQKLIHDCNMGAHSQKIHTLPIPIPISKRGNPSTSTRSKVVVIAGRLDDDQKDAERFVKVMARFLSIRPDYQAVAIGNGFRFVKKLVRKHARDVADRINVLPRSSPDIIQDIELKARIFVCTSRGEGFPNAIAEATCRGCSIVGPSNIAALSFFAGIPCATIARSRSNSDLLDALIAEANEWDSNRRKPETISAHFRSLLAPEQHAHRLCSFLTNARFSTNK